MEAVATMGGVTLGIGPQAPSAAQHRLSDPTTMVGFLRRLVGALDERQRRWRSAEEYLAMYGRHAPCLRPVNFF